MRIAAAGAAAALGVVMGGCASSVEVRGVGTGTAEAAYELRGTRLASLQAQARLLCPEGHQVLREWQRLRRPAPDANMPSRSLAWLAGGAGLADDAKAQLLVHCTAAAAAAPLAVPTLSPAPMPMPSAASPPRQLPDE